MYKVTNMIMIALITIGLTFSTRTLHLECGAPPISYVEIVEEPIVEEIEVEVEEVAVAMEEPIVELEEEELPLSQEEIELIALVTMAEAEGESELGKRLVIDTILNRADSDDPYYPDTVTEVIYQKSQFTSMWNGRVDRCYVDEDICELVREELRSRTNYEVIYFHEGKYSKYGTPMLVEGNHYFSSI